jgi:hypothetical protein
VRLTVRHHVELGADRAVVGDELAGPDGWDALRTRTSGAFALPETREEWERIADARPELEARARRIEAVLARRCAGRVASYGAGNATIECWLNRLAPERELVVADYAPATIERLRPIFVEADCVVHDLSAELPLRADVHLFHRIDTEFGNRRWRAVFRRFRGEPILFVAAGEVDLRGAREQFRYRRRPGSSRAGWVRTRSAIEALWRRTHRGVPVDAGDLPAWELEPR